MTTPHQGTTPRKTLWIGAAILGLALILLLGTWLGGNKKPNASNDAPNQPAPTAASSENPTETNPPTAQPSATTQPEVPDLARRIDGDPTAIGRTDAPLVLIEYADYRCPFCGVYARETLPTLISEYVDSGKLRIEWRDLPLFGEQSFDAAVATRAAGREGLFWEYSSAIYAWDGKGHQDLPRERLIEIAKEVGVTDIAAFTAGLDDQELINAVSADSTEALSLGAQSTPAFIIGEVPLLGAQPLSVFQEVIESELTRLGH